MTKKVAKASYHGRRDDWKSVAEYTFDDGSTLSGAFEYIYEKGDTLDSIIKNEHEAGNNEFFMKKGEY